MVTSSVPCGRESNEPRRSVDESAPQSKVAIVKVYYGERGREREKRGEYNEGWWNRSQRLGKCVVGIVEGMLVRALFALQ